MTATPEKQCPQCGCEQVDHRGLLVCECPAKPSVAPSEPVAWEYRYPHDNDGATVRPLYAAPPAAPAQTESEAYREGMMRAAEIVLSLRPGNDLEYEAIRAEAASAVPSDPRGDGWAAYQPTVVDYPEAGFSELVLIDTLIVWDPPDANGVEVGYAADDEGGRFSTRVGVRWPLPPAPGAKP